MDRYCWPCPTTVATNSKSLLSSSKVRINFNVNNKKLKPILKMFNLTCSKMAHCDLHCKYYHSPRVKFYNFVYKKFINYLKWGNQRCVCVKIRLFFIWWVSKRYNRTLSYAASGANWLHTRFNTENLIYLLLTELVSTGAQGLNLGFRARLR